MRMDLRWTRSSMSLLKSITAESRVGAMPATVPLSWDSPNPSFFDFCVGAKSISSLAKSMEIGFTILLQGPVVQSEIKTFFHTNLKKEYFFLFETKFFFGSSFAGPTVGSRL